MKESRPHRREMAHRRDVARRGVSWFDEFMRTFIAEAGGRTLGDAVAHWHETREQAAQPRPIGAQFELSAFLRQRRLTHPGATRQASLEAWKEHRFRPSR